MTHDERYAQDVQRERDREWVGTMLLLAVSVAVFIGAANAVVRGAGDPRLMVALLTAGFVGMWWAAYRLIRALVRDGWDA